MKITLVGSRYFGASVFDALTKEPEVEIVCVVAPAADDRLAVAARAAGVPVHLLANPKLVPGDAIAEGTDLIIAAHTHARVSPEALERSRLGGVGYHPSLLPRHRGIAAVEWTILQGDAIAGGSVYHLADGWDAGGIAAQQWCFVVKGETARELWERALAPMGLELLAGVARDARLHGRLPAHPQDARFATKAPMIRRPVVLTDGAASTSASLVATVIGPDRPGIVNLLSECARRFDANWAASRMSNLAGEFAGMIHFEVPQDNAEPLAAALRDLESTGLRVVVSVSKGAGVPAGMRAVEIELIGDDQRGIVSQLTRILAERAISIEHIHTEIVSGGDAAKPIFKVGAHLLVPQALSTDALRAQLEALAKQMMVDIALGDRPGSASTPAKPAVRG